MIKRKTFGIKRRKPRRSPKTASRAISISKLVKALDTVFSRFIRLKYAKNGIVFCYTCGHFTHWKKIHAGHFISRYYKETRWNENNVRPQCFMCNIYKKGDTVKFRINLIQEIGENEVVKMEKESARLTKRGSKEREWLENKIEHYKNELARLDLTQ